MALLQSILAKNDQANAYAEDVKKLDVVLVQEEEISIADVELLTLEAKISSVEEVFKTVETDTINEKAEMSPMENKHPSIDSSIDEIVETVAVETLAKTVSEKAEISSTKNNNPSVDSSDFKLADRKDEASNTETMEESSISPKSSDIMVQLGAFRIENNAHSLSRQLEKLDYNNNSIFQEYTDSGMLLHKVVLWGFSSESEARHTLSLIHNQGFEGFIKRP